MKLGIYCAGGLGRETLELANRISRWEDIFFVSDVDLGGGGGNFATRHFRLEDLNPSEVEIVVANGTPRYRREIFNRVEQAGFNFASLIDPSASISPTSRIGRGVLILNNVVISNQTEIGDNVAIQHGVVLGHDGSIGSHCVFGFNSVTSGFVKIGEESFLGINSSIREKISIGDRVIVGMGSVVTRSVENDLVVVGSPARELRKNLDGKIY